MSRQWLIELRESINKSQEEIAEKSGITRQYYGMIESGQRNPSVKAAKQIGKVLNINWTLFFDHQGNKKLHEEKKSKTEVV